MRTKFNDNDTTAVCVGAVGCFFLSFLFTEQASVLAETIRLTCVAAVGFGFYFRQNTTISELINRPKRNMTAAELHEVHLLHDLTGQG